MKCNKFKSTLSKFLPQTLKKIIISLRERLFDTHRLYSYSQEGEDMILRRVFEAFDTGFYVDVGAHHPRRFSNTYFFYKKGWRGINIDAMPGSMALFNKIRPRDINIEQPISDQKTSLTYYGFNEPALNGFSAKLTENRDGKNGYFVTFEKEMETKTLDSVLDAFLPRGIKEIDFLSIDVEGYDFRVLKSIDLVKYKPKLILIEVLDSKYNGLLNSEITHYLESRCYDIYAKTVNTVIYKHLSFNSH